MRAIRWSGDDDRYFGPLTYVYEPRYRKLALMLKSRGDEDEGNGAYLRIGLGAHTLIVALPGIIQPYREKVYPGSAWDEATVKRLGRDWYWNVDEREFGFSYSEGYLSLHYGRQTHDSSTCKQKGWFPPWTQWRHVRHSFYDLDGNHVADVPQRVGKWTRESMDAEQALQDAVPKRTFEFFDFDGERLTATTMIEEREWRFGERGFKWLSLFRKPKISRSLDIRFSGETGKRKGSWKGGTTGHSIEMLPGELHEAAFRRYCAKHDMTFAA